MSLSKFIFGSNDKKRILKNFLLVPLAVLFILGVGVVLSPIREQEIQQYPNPEALEEELIIPSFSVAVFWAPVIEEHLFRAPVLLSYLTFFRRKPKRELYIQVQKAGKIFTAFIAIFTVVYFTQLHILNGGFYLLTTTLFHTGVFAVIMMLLAIKTQSLTYPILAHAANNYLYWTFG